MADCSQSGRTSPDAPTYFRVVSFTPTPLTAPFRRPGEWILGIQRAEPRNRSKLHFPLLPADFAPYLDVIRAAIRSQDVYWVDWNDVHETVMAGVPIDATDRRLLRALEAQQIVSSSDGTRPGS